MVYHRHTTTVPCQAEVLHWRPLCESPHPQILVRVACSGHTLTFVFSYQSTHNMLRLLILTRSIAIMIITDKELGLNRCSDCLKYNITYNSISHFPLLVSSSKFSVVSTATF